MATLTAHVVVDFGGGSVPNFIVEVDSREPGEGGLNAGRTTFFPGEEAHILVFLPKDYYLYTYVCSAGQLQWAKQPQGTKDVSEMVTFIDTDTASVQYPINDAGFTYKWQWTDMGTLTRSDQFNIRLARKFYDPVTKRFIPWFSTPDVAKTVPEHWAAVLDVAYKSDYWAVKLTNVPTHITNVAVLFIARKVGT